MSPIDAHQLDAQDPLAWARDEFEIPLQSDSGGQGTCPSDVTSNTGIDLCATGDGQVTYLCGNSLGLLPKRARTLLIEEIDVWSKRYARVSTPFERITGTTFW